MIYEGQWFDPLTEACKAFLFQSQERVTGDVRLKFFKGGCVADGRRSDFSLYSYKLATYTKEDEFSHEAAAGFIRAVGSAHRDLGADRQGAPPDEGTRVVTLASS